ncbi:dehydrogenase, partial [Verrucomicrobia bacterium]|nr:dehydrogenase [Verrucomicrobiota bacterium]
MCRNLVLLGLFSLVSVSTSFAADSLVVLDENDPFYVDHTFPKLTTPQWIGDSVTDAVVVLAIDDMREPQKYEAFLRPIIDRLKAIDGKSHVSIMSNAIDPSLPHYQDWINEGVSLEVHTLTHPCPLLARNDFSSAEDTFFGGIDLLNHVPGNLPVAYRMPCCDSINSPSPRFYAELFNRVNPAGQFLQIDSSVMCSFTPSDPELPKEWVLNENGDERFARYLPFESFVTTIENYPYPYLIGGKCWEFPCMVPSDWEAQNIQGNNHPDTVRDWKIALDLTVLKKGVFNLVFHPHGWIKSEQVVELIDYAKDRYGDRVAFLN